MTESAHCIRLRPPWQLVRTADATATESRRRWVRRFGRPTGLVTGQRVWLVVERIEDPVPTPNASTQVWLNQQFLGDLACGQTQTRWEIAARLLPRNEMWLDLLDPSRQSADDTGAISPAGIREVRLEIGESDHQPRIESAE